MKKNTNQKWRKKKKLKNSFQKNWQCTCVTSKTITCCTCIPDWRMWQFLRRGLSVWLQQALCQPNLWQIHWKLCSWMWGGLSWKQMWPRCAFIVSFLTSTILCFYLFLYLSLQEHLFILNILFLSCKFIEHFQIVSDKILGCQTLCILCKRWLFNFDRAVDLRDYVVYLRLLNRIRQSYGNNITYFYIKNARNTVLINPAKDSMGAV